MGQKGRSLKHISDNRTLFENKTAEADLGGSFQVRTPENLVHGFEKLDLVHDTPFVRPAIKTENDSGIETPSDTLTNFGRNNFFSSNTRPNLSLSTKRTLYGNKENIPEQIEEVKTPESQRCTYNNSSTISCSPTVKENLNEIVNKSQSSVCQKDETCFVSPETSRFNYDTSLYHSIRETTAVPNSSRLHHSKHSAYSEIDSSLLNKQLGCQPLDGKPNQSTLELSPAAKRNNFVIRARSPIHSTTVGFVQDGEFKRPVNSSGNVCVKCASENYISVKGINYSILNTLGHGGSSIVYEVNYILYINNMKILITLINRF